jgi:hypothetical protein
VLRCLSVSRPLLFDDVHRNVNVLPGDEDAGEYSEAVDSVPHCAAGESQMIMTR